MIYLNLSSEGVDEIANGKKGKCPHCPDGGVIYISCYGQDPAKLKQVCDSIRNYSGYRGKISCINGGNDTAVYKY